MQDRQLIAVLPLPDTPAELASEDDARPVVKLFAEGGELQLSRIQLYRDVYYLTAEQVDPYGTPGSSNPIYARRRPIPGAGRQQPYEPRRDGSSVRSRPTP